MQEIGNVYITLKANQTAAIKEGTGVEAGKFFLELDVFNPLTGAKTHVDRKHITQALLDQRIAALQASIDGYNAMKTDLSALEG